MRRTLSRLAVAAALVASVAAAGGARAAQSGAPLAPGVPAEPARTAGGELQRPFTSEVKPSRTLLGEPFDWVVEVRLERGERVELPKELVLGEGFELLEAQVEQLERDGEPVARIALRGAVFELGEKRLRDLELAVAGPDKGGRLVVPGGTVVGAGAVQDEDAELRDIMPPVEVTVPSYALLGWGAALLALAVIGWLLARWLRRRAQAPRPAAPPLPLDQRALAALEALEAERLPSRGELRPFHFRLSEILRSYLGDRFAIAAPDMTTEELLAALGARPTPGLDLGRFRTFCLESDLVKFARAPSTVEQCDVALGFAREVVRATTAAATPATAPAASPAASPATAPAASPAASPTTAKAAASPATPPPPAASPLATILLPDPPPAAVPPTAAPSHPTSPDAMPTPPATAPAQPTSAVLPSAPPAPTRAPAESPAAAPSAAAPAHPPSAAPSSPAPASPPPDKDPPDGSSTGGAAA